MKKAVFILFVLILVHAKAQKVENSNETQLPKEILDTKVINEKGDTIKFKHVINELKGSVVFWDFWASWCGPCLREMKHSKKLQKKISDKKIAFLFLSTDDNQQAWLRMKNAIRIEGFHYRIASEDKKKFQNYFQIQGIPYYVILDKKGNIANANAPWPREERLINELKRVCNLK